MEEEENPPQPDALEPDARDEASAEIDEQPDGEEAVEARAEDDGGLPRTPPWIAHKRPLRALDLVVLVAILLVSGVAHFARLSNPDAPIPPPPPGQTAPEDSPYDTQCVEFPRLSKTCHAMIPLDEWHYIPDARDVILFGTESDKRVPPDDGAYVVHPPVGKWGIAAGIKLFGDRGFGWRAVGALFGTLSTLFVYLLARRLWPSPWAAAMAAFLLTTEGLWFVMSRVAMLDIYAAVFLLAGIWLLIEDHARRMPEATGIRWWRIGAGVMFGLAIASKWSVAPFIVVAVGFALMWEFRAAGWNGESAAGVAKRIVFLVLTFALLPMTVYVATYTPWFVDEHRYNPPRCEPTQGPSGSPKGSIVDRWKRTVPGQWLCYQTEMVNFHRDLEKFTTEESTPDATPGTGSPTATGTLKPAHPYFGNAWAWPWIGRPVAHHYESRPVKDGERVKQVLSAPNPVIWYAGFFVALPMLLLWTIRGRDRVAPLLFALFFVGWLPYLLADLVGRPVFLFYATPMVPFLVLAVVHVFVRMFERFDGMALAFAATFVTAAALMFAYLYPVLAAYPIGQDGFWGWSGRMLLKRDCGLTDAIKNLCWI